MVHLSLCWSWPAFLLQYLTSFIIQKNLLLLGQLEELCLFNRVIFNSIPLRNKPEYADEMVAKLVESTEQPYWLTSKELLVISSPA